MKNFLVLVMVSLMLSMPAFAKNVIVQSLNNFSSTNPVNTISFRVVETTEFKNGYTLKKGTIINTRVEEVSEPKRGKRNVHIVVRPTNIKIPDKSGHGKLLAKITPYKKMDKKESAKKGAVSATGIIIPGFTPIYYFCKGFKNPEKNKSRMASGGQSAYKNSPFVYFEMGDDLYFRQGDYMKMKIYHKK